MSGVNLLEVDNTVYDIECMTDTELSDIETDLDITPDGNSSRMYTILKKIWAAIYPVGSIYMSTSSTSPAVLFGGTWVRIQDRFLLSAGSNFTAGNTGGSKDAVVVSHNHSLSGSTGSSSVSHTHPIGGNTGTNAAQKASHNHAASDYSVYASAGVGAATGGDLIVGSTPNHYLYTTGTAQRKLLPTKSTEITNLPAHNHTLPNNTGASGSTSHSHTLSGNTATQGSSGINANLPPYLVVNVWKRTA